MIIPNIANSPVDSMKPNGTVTGTSKAAPASVSAITRLEETIETTRRSLTMVATKLRNSDRARVLLTFAQTATPRMITIAICNVMTKLENTNHPNADGVSVDGASAINCARSVHVTQLGQGPEMTE